MKVVRSNRSVGSTVLTCTECDHTLSIWRKNSKRKKHGHVKTMYCPKCMEVSDFIEQSEHEYNTNTFLKQFLNNTELSIL